MAGVEGICPVTGGVPIAEGAAQPDAVFTLRDGQGKAVPLQTCVLAPWKDGSARWVLLDFQCAPAAGGHLDYVLSWDAKEKPPQPAGAVACQEDQNGPVLRSGDVTVSRGKGALVSLAERFDVDLSLTDAEGRVCEARVESAVVDTAGPLRSSLSLVGAFHAPGGDRLFQFRLRVSLYAGLSLLRVEPMILVDPAEGIIQQIRDLRLVLRPHGGAAGRARLGGSPGWQGDAASGVRLFQYDDQNYRLEGAEGEGGRAPGWGEIEDGSGTVVAALREFWQQWPKSVEASSEGLSIGLFPSFKEGAYAHMEPPYKHQWLFDGDRYQLATGQARGWEVWVELGGDGKRLSRAINAPLIPVADPAQAIGTGVWDAIAPAGAPGMAEYDAGVESPVEAYCRSIEEHRDYGAMNWCDSFAGPFIWMNHEYDHTDHLLVQYARTGDPKYLYVAQATGRHSSEVDTVHYVNADLAKYYNDMKPRIEGPPPPGTEDHGIDNVAGLHSIGYPARAGMVHGHTIGHVGRFYSIDHVRELYGPEKNPYLSLDPFNLGHVWTRGVMHLYFLTGDAFLKERVERVGANLAQLAEDREYRFIGHTHCGRIAGWTLQALSGAYEIGLDERYLNAMKLIAEDAMDAQDPNCGGWLIHPMFGCNCKTKHTGMATFLTSILINGLCRYYFLSGDERLPEVIERAVTFLDYDTWREERRGWRGNSCPAESHSVSQADAILMTHVNAIRIADNPEHLRILRVAWEARRQGLRQTPVPAAIGGKASVAGGCPEVVALLESRAADR